MYCPLPTHNCILFYTCAIHYTGGTHANAAIVLCAPSDAINRVRNMRITPTYGAVSTLHIVGAHHAPIKMRFSIQHVDSGVLFKNTTGVPISEKTIGCSPCALHAANSVLQQYRHYYPAMLGITVRISAYYTPTRLLIHSRIYFIYFFE